MNLQPAIDLFFFFFNDTATTEIYTLSLHDALPISSEIFSTSRCEGSRTCARLLMRKDRKSTRLNSSHLRISYAVFCLKKKTQLRATRYRLRPEPTPVRSHRRPRAQRRPPRLRRPFPAHRREPGSSFFFKSPGPPEPLPLSPPRPFPF